jgi:hypothetical protein
MSSNPVHAPIKLTKNDRTTYPWMNDFGIIFPCMSAIFCIDIPVVEFVEFDMATELFECHLTRAGDRQESHVVADNA